MVCIELEVDISSLLYSILFISGAFDQLHYHFFPELSSLIEIPPLIPYEFSTRHNAGADCVMSLCLRGSGAEYTQIAAPHLMKNAAPMAAFFLVIPSLVTCLVFKAAALYCRVSITTIPTDTAVL